MVWARALALARARLRVNTRIRITLSGARRFEGLDHSTLLSHICRCAVTHGEENPDLCGPVARFAEACDQGLALALGVMLRQTLAAIPRLQVEEGGSAARAAGPLAAGVEPIEVTVLLGGGGGTERWPGSVGSGRAPFLNFFKEVNPSSVSTPSMRASRITPYRHRVSMKMCRARHLLVGVMA
ncbi:hypothetical protein HaLaN_24077 [Haematococcus lacustris]|uniref:Uncharacterized protein n=1 Tax=Haematococcus lacustris TaxID=44745 RepID=A0A699ZT38_HAELA|nr:hypothetical protein HaLaN_24077 [Haematococcus lacustris]